MTSAKPKPIVAVPGMEPTYSVREAAALLRRSYSWLDQRVRNGEFVIPDGAVVRPLRTPGGYRRFTLEMLRALALSCYRHGWFSFGELKSTFYRLATDAYGATSKGTIPG